MHELSIAMNIIDMIQSACRQQGYDRIGAVRVQVGKASGIMTDALIFAFDTAKTKTMAGNAVLEIDEIPVGGTCGECKADFTTNEPYVFQCPECGGKSFRITMGHELKIVELEVDE